MTHLSPQSPADIFGQPRSQGFQVIGGSLLQTSNSHCCMKALHIMLKLLTKRMILKQTTSSSHDKNVSMVSKSFWSMTAPFGLKIIEGNHCRFCEKRIAWLASLQNHLQRWITSPLCHEFTPENNFWRRIAQGFHPDYDFPSNREAVVRPVAFEFFALPSLDLKGHEKFLKWERLIMDTTTDVS